MEPATNPWATGLAWDDEPEMYMAPLREELARYQIELHLTRSDRDFGQHVGNGQWDFLVTDLYAGMKKTGIEITRTFREATAGQGTLPLFLVTKHPDLLDDRILDALPASTYVRHKMDPSWMAVLIRDELKLRGMYTNPAQVFLVCAVKAQMLSEHGERVDSWLRERGVDVKRIDRQSVPKEIARGLLDRISSSKAIIAVFSPDDSALDGTERPRANVMFEIGMVMGAYHGAERLIILEHEDAKLESDFGGVLTLRYRQIEEALEALERELRARSVSLRG